MNPDPDRELFVQTYSGGSIPNHIDPDPSPSLVELARKGVSSLLQASVKNLGPPTGRYNCHGLVFASRRTNIPPVGMDDVLDIDNILGEDQYDPVSLSQVGDIVVYRRSTGEVDHTGFVSRVDSLGSQPIVWVWSMWGGLGEFEHRVEHSPYNDCTPEFWRLRDQ